MTKDCYFWGKSGNREKSGNIKKRQCNHVYIFKVHVFAKLHEEIMIVDEIRGHLVILPFYRAQPETLEGPPRKRAKKFEVELLNIPNFV